MAKRNIEIGLNNIFATQIYHYKLKGENDIRFWTGIGEKA